MGDRLGTPGAVGFFFLSALIENELWPLLMSLTAPTSVVRHKLKHALSHGIIKSGWNWNSSPTTIPR